MEIFHSYVSLPEGKSFFSVAETSPIFGVDPWYFPWHWPCWACHMAMSWQWESPRFIHLVGGCGFNPSEKWWSSSVGIMTFPIYWKNMFETTSHMSKYIQNVSPKIPPCLEHLHLRSRDVAIGSAGRARLDLTGAKAHGQVGDRRVLTSWGRTPGLKLSHVKQ